MSKFRFAVTFEVEADSQAHAFGGLNEALVETDLGFQIDSGYELDKDGQFILPDDEKCLSCKKPYTADDMDGGRCLGCGAMISTEVR